MRIQWHLWYTVTTGVTLTDVALCLCVAKTATKKEAIKTKLVSEREAQRRSRETILQAMYEQPGDLSEFAPKVRHDPGTGVVWEAEGECTPRLGVNSSNSHSFRHELYEHGLKHFPGLRVFLRACVPARLPCRQSRHHPNSWPC